MKRREAYGLARLNTKAFNRGVRYSNVPKGKTRPQALPPERVPLRQANGTNGVVHDGGSILRQDECEKYGRANR